VQTELVQAKSTEGEKVELEKQITALQTELVQAKSTEGEKVELEKQITALQTELAQAKSKEGEKVELLNKQIASLQTDLTKAQYTEGEVKSLNDQIASLKSELELAKSKEEEVASLKAQIASFQSQLTQAKSKEEEVELLNKQIASFQSQLTQAKFTEGEKVELEKKIDSLQSNLEQAKFDLEQAKSKEAEKVKLEEQILTFQSKLLEAEKTKEANEKEVRDKITSLEKEVENQKKILSNTKNNLKESLLRTQQSETELTEAKKSMENGIQINKNLIQKMGEMEEAEKKKQDEIQKINQDMSSLKKELNDAKSLKKEVEQNIEKSRKELSEYKRNVVAKFTEIFNKEVDVDEGNVIEKIGEKLDNYNKIEDQLKKIQQINETLKSTSSDNNIFKFSELLKIPEEENSFINNPTIPSISEFKKEFENYMKSFKKSPISSLIDSNEKLLNNGEFDDFNDSIKKNYVILIKYIILMFRFHSRDPLFMRYQSIIGYEKKKDTDDIKGYVKSININIAITFFKKIYSNNNDIRTKLNTKYSSKDIIFHNFNDDIKNYASRWESDIKIEQDGFIKENGLFESIINEIFPYWIKSETFKEIIDNLYYLKIQKPEYEFISEKLTKLKIVSEKDSRFKPHKGNYKISTEIFLNDIMLRLFIDPTHKLQEYGLILRILLKYNSNLFNNLSVLNRIKEYSIELREIEKKHLSHNDTVQTILRIRGDGSGSSNCRFNIENEEKIDNSTSTIKLKYSAINKQVYKYYDEERFLEDKYYTGEGKNDNVPQQEIIGGPYNQVYNKNQSNEDIVKSDYMKSLIEEVKKGTILCLFAYAPSGAGKSFTFFGDSNSKTNKPGISILICNQMMSNFSKLTIDMFEIGAFSDDESSKLTNMKEQIFKKMEKGDGKKDEKEYVWMSEIENEFVAKGGKMKKTTTLTEFLLKTTAERKTFPTPNNKESSRTHLCIIFNFDDDKMFVIFDFAGVEGSFDCDKLLDKFREYYPSEIKTFNDINSEDEINNDLTSIERARLRISVIFRIAYFINYHFL
jgi:hypothetical protein